MWIPACAGMTVMQKGLVAARSTLAKPAFAAHFGRVALPCMRPLAQLEQMWNIPADADSYFRPRRARA